jgi:hypothetical protein
LNQIARKLDVQTMNERPHPHASIKENMDSSSVATKRHRATIRSRARRTRPCHAEEHLGLPNRRREGRRRTVAAGEAQAREGMTRFVFEGGAISSTFSRPGRGSRHLSEGALCSMRPSSARENHLPEAREAAMAAKADETE